MSDTAPAVMDIRTHAASHPDRTAIVCGERRLSYAELEALANRLADVLRGQGLQRGDHVATLLGNGPEALALAWAGWRCGVYLTPMATSLVGSELAYLVRDSDARVVLAEAALGAQAAALPPLCGAGVTWLSLGGPIEGFRPLEPLLQAASPRPHAHEPPGALMLYTSGTTGAPKGVWRPLLPADFKGTPPFAGDLAEHFDFTGPELRYLSPAPLYHAAPLRFSLAVTAAGGTVFVMPRFDAAQALDLLERERITHSQWVPAMFQRLLELPEARRVAFKAPAHRMAIHAAAPCPPPLKRRMIDWWGPILMEYYAGSEGVGMTKLDSADWLQHPGSVGRVARGVMHIVGDDGQELPPGQTGLICFSGLPPFQYHKAPDKTAARTTPQGWQTLGDIGHVTADGYLYLSDRLDDMIISGGVNVYPQEVENALREAPGVWDCAVVGEDDERFGERPVAFVVPAPGVDAADPGFIPALQAHCVANLGKFKRPAQFHVLAELPRSPTGKLLRRKLREHLKA
jgi:acyl-CoA synthetase (AMP-forming)/AMP-acid ligase II